MRLNGAAFMMDYQDMQISAASNAVATSSTKANLGDATISGLELEMTALVSDGFTLGLNLGYLKDDIDSLKGALTSNTVVIARSNDLPMTPDWTLSLMAKYDMEIANGGRVSLRADYAIKDDYYTRAENLPENLIDNYKNLNLGATYYAPGGTWETRVGVRNATDAEYYESATPFATFGLTFGQPVRPRTFFVSMT